MRYLEKDQSDTYKNLLQITVITCVWPENMRFKGHIDAFSQMGGPLATHRNTLNVCIHAASPLMGLTFV